MERADELTFLSELSDEDYEKYEQLLRLESAYQNFGDFVKYSFPGYVFNWHHQVMIDRLDKLIHQRDQRLMIFLPPRHGKLTWHSTEVLTPKGWTTHGQLKVGDYVYHPSGRAVQVLALSEEIEADCLVETTLGTIGCHENHEWEVYDRGYGKYRVLETKRLEKRALVSGGRYPVQLRNIGQVEGVERDLPLDPYYLGLWLGNGKSASPEISAQNGDIEPFRYLEKRGFEVRNTRQGVGCTYFSFSGQGITRTLRELNLYNNKHIPEIYLRASVEQRLELLAGLIDSDGSRDPKSRIRYVTTNEKIRDGIYELLVGLGQRPYIQKVEPTMSSGGVQGVKPVYTIGFQPDIEIPIQVERKKIKRFAKRRREAIIGVKRVKPQLGRCIQVDSEDGLYLVGKELIPTHNSELVSRRFPAYYLGRRPDSKIIACSYSAGLATNFSRDVQRIMESAEYNEIFPDVLIPNTPFSRSHPDNPKYKRQTSFFEIIDHHGDMLSTGVGGSITGMGADLAIIDDPVKNEEEAMSETMREALFGWYNSTLYTRLEGGANLVICQTRWHKSDLSGKLLEEMEIGGEKWEIINFPAIATKEAELNPQDPREEGEALWEGKYPLPRLEIIKKQVGTRVWSSLYQQSPVIEGGNIIKQEWFQFYHRLPFDVHNWREAYTITSWDLTFKKTGKSYVVGVVLSKYQNQFYLVDMYRAKADLVETGAAIEKMAKKYPACKTHLIEDKANGPAIVSLLRRKVPNLVEVNAGVSKDERLHSVAPIFEAGNFLLPMNSPLSKVIMEELISFPNADNDDIVDAISQGLNRFMEMKGIRHLRAMTRWALLASLVPYDYCLRVIGVGG